MEELDKDFKKRYANFLFPSKKTKMALEKDRREIPPTTGPDVETGGAIMHDIHERLTTVPEAEIGTVRAFVAAMEKLVTVSTIQDKLARADHINEMGRGVNLYDPETIATFPPGHHLPFRISPNPFSLPEELKSNIVRYGHAFAAFYKATRDVLKELPKDHRWHEYLNHSKPDFILKASEESPYDHTFVRPDLIMTESGILTAEIETSPFGVALSHFMDSAYRSAGQVTLKKPKMMERVFLETIYRGGSTTQNVVFIVTDHTKKYQGQFEYLAYQMGKYGFQAEVMHIDDMLILGDTGQCICQGRNIDIAFRGFCLYEATEDERLKALIETPTTRICPPPKPQMEEKALMGMIYDEELQGNLRARLGEHFDTLQKIIPPTFVIDGDGPPENFPHDISRWEELATLPKSQRKYVIKISGYDETALWAKGLHFLHRMNQQQVRDLLTQVAQSPQTYIIQKFEKPVTVKQEYVDPETKTLKEMDGRVRITPYFYTGDGSLVTAKATVCPPDSDKVHTRRDSVNSSVL